MLGQFTKSGRYFVDPEKEINDDVDGYNYNRNGQKEKIEVISNTSIQDYENVLSLAFDLLNLNEHKSDVTEKEVEDLVKAASLAPSGGNIQPWKWIFKKGNLFLFVDKHRTSSVLNYANTASYIAHGTAIENMLIKANDLNLSLNIKQLPLEEHPNLTAVITFTRGKNDEYSYAHLLPYLEKRYTNRKVKSEGQLSDDQLAFFSGFKMLNDQFRLTVYSDRQKMNELKRVMTQVDQLYYTSKLGHQNFNQELRWTPKQAKVTRDGVDLDTIDLTPTEKAGFRVSKKWEVVRYLKEWNLGAAYSKLTSKGIDAASALVVVIGPNDLKAQNYLDCGRLIEQIWLSATSMNLALQPMSISSFLFSRAHFDQSEEFSSLKPDLLRLDKKFRSITGISDSESPFFVFRLAKADEHEIRALRRDVKDFLIHD